MSRSGEGGPSWGQLRRGLLLLGAMALAMLAIFFLDDILREIAEGPELVLLASRAGDLEPGSQVWVAGVPVGRVISIEFRAPAAGGEADDRPVVVRAVLSQEVAHILRKNATARIRAPALLAPPVVAIAPGGAVDPPFDFSDTLFVTPALDREAILARAEALEREIELLQPLAEELATRVTEGPGSLAGLTGDTVLLARFDTLAMRLERSREALTRGSGYRILNDTALVARLDRLFERADVILAGIAPLEEEAGRLTTTLEGLAARTARLQEGMEAGRGTAARLVLDRALERELGTLQARIDSVRTELMANPFDWIRFRIF